MNVSGSLLPATTRLDVECRDPLVSDGCADAVLSLLRSHGWAVAATPEANVHCTSPDGRLFVGWLPEDKSAWQRDIVWRVTARPATAEAWTQEFGLATPTEAVATFLSVLIATPTPS